MTDTPADILVVEDDPDLRALLLDELTDAGHTCAGCGDLSSAQGFMREQMPKLVLSDLHLPDGNGLTLLEILKPLPVTPDRKSTRLNSSHVAISYAVFSLKKKTRIPS